jgi:ABC-type nitrate/sulfonate/bicarbonate transport system substrate-binding protein
MSIGETAIRALVAGALTGLASPAAAESNLTIMVFQGMQNLPLLAAQSKGLFAKRGLKVDIKIAPNSDELRNGLAEGRYQIVHSAADNAVAMVEMAKIDTAIVIGGDNGLYHLYAQPEIKSIADLRGKRVVVDAPNTAYAFQLYDMLRLAGLDKGDYEVKVSGATFKRLEDLEKDKANAATMLNPPFSLRGAKSGLKDLGEAVKAIGPYQATAGFVLRSWAKANPDTLVNYLGAYLEGQRWAMDPGNKAEAIKLYVEGLKVPEDIAGGCYDAFLSGTAKDAAFDMEGFKNVLALRARFTDSVPLSADKYVDLSYYQKTLAGL